MIRSRSRAADLTDVEKALPRLEQVLMPPLTIGFQYEADRSLQFEAWNRRYLGSLFKSAKRDNNPLIKNSLLTIAQQLMNLNLHRLIPRAERFSRDFRNQISSHLALSLASF